jgi:uncharacterized protein YndB with AHSA1/START domain
MTTISVVQAIQAPLEQAYLAFTNSSALREWLCDMASVKAYSGGRYYLWWNGDYYSSGEIKALEPNKSVTFQWFGRGEIAPSEVHVAFSEKSGLTNVVLSHTIPDGQPWDEMAEGFRQEWTRGLENLASVLQTGIDHRIFDRPMLGIVPGDFTREQAEQLGVPVTEGMRIDDVVDGMGAQLAGLQHNDVIVSMAGKPVTNEFNSLPLALRGHKGGETVEVIIYRGKEKKTVSMTLSRRRVPEVSFDPAVLAEAIHVRYEEALSALEKAFAGVSQAEASHVPAPGEWSAQEVLAHLIHGERFNLSYFAEAINGFERQADGFGNNLDSQVRATVAAFGTTDNLLKELRRLSDEVVAFIREFPPEFVAYKSTYFKVTWPFLEGQFHTLAHLDQIKAAIQAARQ